MYLALTEEISEDVCNKAFVISKLAKELKVYFDDKSYGNSIKKLFIGVITVHPKFDFFFKTRKKYTKSKAVLEYDVKLDHNEFSKSNTKEVLLLLSESILNSLDVISELKLPDFDLFSFRRDLEDYFEEAMKE